MFKYFELCKSERFYGSKLGIIMLFKNFLSDLMSSVFLPILIEKDNDKEGIFSNVFDFFLFAYQLSIIYNKENYLLAFVKTFFGFIFNIKKNRIESEIEKKCKNLMLTILNETMPILYLKIFHMCISRKFNISSKLIKSLSDDCLYFNKNFRIKWEFILISMLINIIIWASFFISRNQRMEFCEKKNRINVKLTLRIVSSIMIYYYVEELFQFYFFMLI